MGKQTKLIDFMQWRKIALAFSAVLLLASIISLGLKGLNFGLDFTGGTLVEVDYSESVDLQEVRQTLSAAGYENAVVVNFGSDTDVLVRLPVTENAKVGDEVLATLRNATDLDVDLRRTEFVGPSVGEELREQGGLAMLLALAVVLVYVAMRFQLKFAVGAVVALAHDVTIVLGIFSMLGFDFDLTVLAAVLAVIGYSLNDTIVVSDRMRENFRMLRKGDSTHIINVSLSETLGRTLVTSFTTAVVLLALILIGGELIFGFGVALLIGVLIGTYSSVYVAANVMLMMGISREDLIIPEKEGEDAVDMMP